MPLWNAKELIIVFNKVRLVGVDAGTFVNLEMNNDAFTLEEGNDGSWARTRHASTSAVCTVTLMKASPSNDMLAARHALDRLSGAGGGEFLLKDINSRLLASAPEVWIKRWPTIELGDESGNYEWAFEGPNWTVFPGGMLGGELTILP